MTEKLKLKQIFMIWYDGIIYMIWYSVSLYILYIFDTEASLQAYYTFDKKNLHNIIIY